MKVFYRVICLYTLVILLTACGGKAIATEPAATLTEIPINTSPNATEVTTALETLAPIDSADPFKVTVTQYIMDTAGFHEIATELSQTQTIDPEYFSTVIGVAKVLSQTTWPADLEDHARSGIRPWRALDRRNPDPQAVQLRGLGRADRQVGAA